MIKIHRLSHFILLFALISFCGATLSGCSETLNAAKTWKGALPNDPNDPTSNRPDRMTVTKIEPLKNGQQNAAAPLPPVKVAILLPLSGQHERLGQSMLQAAQMALFEMGYESFELIPRDTAGNAQGANEAARSALNEGAELIIGPLFADSVRSVQQVTHGTGINIVSFSTDWTLAGEHTYLMGFMPFAQVNRVTDYASSVGFKNFGVISPINKYGDTVTRAFEEKVKSQGNMLTRSVRFMPTTNDLQGQIKAFAQETSSLDAVFIPVGGTQAEIIAGTLTYHDITPNNVKYMGTGLWDDNRLVNERNLRGAIFAGPSPTQRRGFENRYQNLYGSKPARLSSLAYDATALAAVLAQRGNGANGFNRSALTNPNGFAGTDGIFRFKRDGLVERGLAVLEFSGGNVIEVSPAPTSFELTR
ncbi:MAG: penicillin-binding protein activator [Alphaproteobacteria bacterium]|nr:penicillin-binding protein activator [Alphaproteobacteria bacterium]